MEIAQIKFKYDEEEDENTTWEMRPVVFHFLVHTLELKKVEVNTKMSIPKFATFVATLLVKKPIEIRWNIKGDLQGHYISMEG